MDYYAPSLILGTPLEDYIEGMNIYNDDHKNQVINYIKEYTDLMKNNMMAAIQN